MPPSAGVSGGPGPRVQRGAAWGALSGQAAAEDGRGAPVEADALGTPPSHPSSRRIHPSEEGGGLSIRIG